MQNTHTKFVASVSDEIAVIGYGCRLPGSLHCADELWQEIIAQHCLITEVPADRFSRERFEHPLRETKGHTVTFKAGIIGDVTLFDAAFFKMGSLEAQTLDPQQRLALELTYEALEQAGITPQDIKGSDAAVFVGAASTDMAIARADDALAVGPYTMTGTNLSIISNRLSYFYDLHGQSMTVDTACSSSLTALHKACEALQLHSCSLALTGGVNILLSPLPFIGFSQAHMLSPSGRCKVFAADADGYVRAEGGAMLLLKRLDDALRDHDPIYAVIEKTGLNQDGRTNGIALPSGAAQQALLKSIYADADVSSLIYIEAHGTGTAAGDPIECQAVGSVLGQPVADCGRPLYIGSVKANVGHLETASGMAGLMKVLAMFKHGTIPPQLYADSLNPKIDFKGLNLKVPAAELPFPAVSEPALIGLNSFGFGGSNAHALLRRFDRDYFLEAARAERLSLAVSGPFELKGALRAVSERSVPMDAAASLSTSTAAASLPSELKQSAEANLEGVQPAAADGTEQPLYFLISAASRGALKNLASRYAELLGSNPQLSARETANAAYLKRALFAERLFIQAARREALILVLKAAAQDLELKQLNLDPALGCGVAASAQPQASRFALVFAGNGAQYPGMGHELYLNLPAFSRRFDEAADCLAKLQDLDFKALIKADAARQQELADFSKPAVAQPFIFAIEAALGQTLLDLGFKPAACCGHSVGEVAAALTAGCLTLEEACRVIVERSKAQGRTSALGGMAAVKLDESTLKELIAASGLKSIALAAHNAPGSFTLSGLKSELAELAGLIKHKRGACRLLDLNYAFHSSLMEPVKDELLQALKDVHGRQGTIPFYSALSAGRLNGSALDAFYWWRNVRETVRFEETIKAAAADGIGAFIEITPKAILSSYIKQVSASLDESLISEILFNAGKDRQSSQFELSVLRLTAKGFKRDLTPLFFGPCASPDLLPHYPFERERAWPSESSESAGYFHTEAADALLGYKLPFTQAYISELDVKLKPFLAGHQVQGQVILPFAAYLSTALKAAALSEGNKRPLSLVNIEIKAPLTLSGGVKRLLTQVGPKLEIVFSGRDLGAPNFTELASMRALPQAVTSQPVRLDLDKELKGCTAVKPQAVYAAALTAGIDYEVEYRRLKQVYLGSGEVWALLDTHIEQQNLSLSPAGLDGALQLLFLLKPQLAAAAAARGEEAVLDYTLYLPVSAQEFYAAENGLERLYARFRLLSAGTDSVLSSIEFYDPSGFKVGALSGLRYRRVSLPAEAVPYTYAEELRALPVLCSFSHQRGSALVCAFKEALSAALSRQSEDEGAALCRAALCALAGKYADCGTGPAAPEEIFGCLIEDRALPLVRVLLDLCCEYGLGTKAEADLYELDAETLGTLNFASLLNALLVSAPQYAALAQLLQILDLNFKDALELGSLDALQLDFLIERAAGFNAGRLALQERLGAAVMKARAALPETQCLSILEITPLSEPLLSSALCAPQAGLAGLELTRLALTESQKAQLNLKTAELSVPGAPAPTVCTAAELASRIRSEKLRFDAVVFADPELAELGEADGTALADLIQESLRADGVLLTVNANSSLLASLVRALRTLQAPAAAALPEASGDLVLSSLSQQGFALETLQDCVALLRRIADNQAAEAAGEMVLPLISASFKDTAAAVQPCFEAQVLPLAPDRQACSYFNHLIRGEASPKLMRKSLEADLKTLPQLQGTAHQTSGRLLLKLDLRAVTLSELPAALYYLKERLLDAKEAGIAGIRVLTDAEETVLQGVSASDCTLTSGEEHALSTGALRALLRTAIAELKLTGVKLIEIVPDAAPAALGLEIAALSPVYEEIILSAEGRFARLTQAAPRNGLFAGARQCVPADAAGAARHEPIAAGETAFKETNRALLGINAAAPADFSLKQTGNAGTLQQGRPAPLTGRVLSFDKAGRFNSLNFKRRVLPPVGADEVLIKVKASALNFRDVLWASGLLPDEALESGFAGASLGLECSGEVITAGAQVKSVRPGQRVMAFGSSCFGDYIITKASAVLVMPEKLSFAEAASLPVAFFTAYYSLVYKAQARHGESVLIHGAAGGVGLAALQIALDLGLKVYATAGSPLKRALLKNLGAHYVFDSRSLTFAGDIKEATQGEGVDIVLNSLYDDAAALSLSLLKPLGRFIELGKRDFYADHPLFLKPFKDNLSYFGVDADELLKLKPALCAEVMGEVFKGFAEGRYHPIALNLYPESALTRAFTDLRSALSIGKLVVLKDSRAGQLLRRAPEPACAQDASLLENLKQGWCVISGGLGGLGQALTVRLLKEGFKRIILIGRRSKEAVLPELIKLKAKAQAETADTLAEELPRNCKLCYVSSALTDITTLKRDLSALTLGEPITLCVHAAGFLVDGILANLTKQSFEDLLKVKLKGACSLTACCQSLNAKAAQGRQQLHCVFFSSMASLLGSPGQGNYAAANGALESLARVLNRRGIAAYCLGWGQVKDAGMLKGKESVSAALERRLGAAGLLSSEVAEEVLTALIQAPAGVYWYFKARWQQAAALALVQRRFAAVADLFEVTDAGIGEENLKDKLAELSGRELEQAFLELIEKQVALLLGIEPKSLNGQTELAVLGMDSLTLMELTVRLTELLDFKLTPEVFASCRTLNSFAKALASLWQGADDETLLISTMQQQHGLNLKNT